MKKMEGFDAGVAPPSHLIAAVAINGSRKTKHVINWALEKFVPDGIAYFKLLHVRPVISRIPTLTGNVIPITQVHDDVAAAFRKEVESRVTDKLLPYKKICTKRQVQVEIVQIESDDVETAIASEIRKSNIKKLVIGTSSRSMFSRGHSLSLQISQSCPTFCTVYAISKGKLSSMRASNSETNDRFREEIDSATSCPSDMSSSRTSSSRTDSEWTDQGWDESSSHFRPTSLPPQQFQALSIINNSLHKRMPSAGMMPQISESSVLNSPVENQLTETSHGNQADIHFEVEKLRIELRHTRGMYAMAQGEAINVSRKLDELQRNRLEEQEKLKQLELKEQKAEQLARQEKQRYEAARRESDLLKQIADREAEEREDAELIASQKAKEKERHENALSDCFYQYRKFTWEEIESATSSFSENLKIGMGAYGTVYRCSFHQTAAAVKILHTKDASKSKHFQQELQILSQIRHPHLLTLLGACPERACLVYEFMENGSLEDRLLIKDNTPPLLWFDRFRIAWEIASALIFLHSSRPKSIIHRDLKPANILIDRNNVCKIGDVGLSAIIDNNTLLANYKDTAPVGTMSYIDPEYQRTGVVSPESDVYAFGIIVLQLLTGKPATALAHVVEVAMENNQFLDILDQKAGEWPDKETKHLADMALRCTELRRRDRPSLHGEVLPLLENMKELAEKARDVMLVSALSPPPPNHFICPILQELMADPCVAADGYTYERKGIEAWLREKDTSPVTNRPLPHKFLLSNYTLLSAIMAWKVGKEC